MNTVKWIFRDGATAIECSSFPFAFRTMFAKVKQGVEKGQRKYDEMIRSMSIVSPMVDRSTGKPKVYTYTAAVEFATNIGLLTSEGQLDKRAMGKW